ncbi:MAG TPA: hypothetical protein ENJ87_04735 [Gammaproteobacteria bacterium]|nr:hypothetical protein [Gammaproteobacteria bacterium]
MLNLDAGSILQGSGTFVGNVDNTNGTVRPGGTGATGILTINGDYIQGINGILEIELQGTTVGTGYDQLAVSGNIIANGTIAVSDSGFSPSVSDNFIVMTSGGLLPITGTNKVTFPVGYALPVKGANQYDITFQNNNSVFFDNFGGDLEWNNANNWSTGFVPQAGVDIDTASLITGGTIQISGGVFDINNLVTDSDINNTGGSLTVAGDVTVQNNFVYTQDGATALTQFDGVVNNTSSTGVQIDNLNGNMIINGNVIGNVKNDGVLSGSGMITGNMMNGGEFDPGASLGTFTIDGDLTLLSSSVLNIEIAGLLIGQEYDELVVTGNILFDGILNVIVDNSTGYTGNIDDSFDPINFASGSGTLALTASSGYTYDLSISGNKLNLLTTSVPGLFIPEIQSDVVTLTNTIQDVTEFENIDETEEMLEETEDDENDEALMCT